MPSYIYIVPSASMKPKSQPYSSPKVFQWRTYSIFDILEIFLISVHTIDIVELTIS